MGEILNKLIFASKEICIAIKKEVDSYDLCGNSCMIGETKSYLQSHLHSLVLFSFWGKTTKVHVHFISREVKWNLSESVILFLFKNI